MKSKSNLGGLCDEYTRVDTTYSVCFRFMLVFGLYLTITPRFVPDCRGPSDYHLSIVYLLCCVRPRILHVRDALYLLCPASGSFVVDQSALQRGPAISPLLSLSPISLLPPSFPPSLPLLSSSSPTSPTSMKDLTTVRKARVYWNYTAQLQW